MKHMLQNLQGESFGPSAFVSSKDRQVRDGVGGRGVLQSLYLVLSN